MSDTARRLVVLYGSQTGTAQDVAERIERDAIRRHFAVTVKPLDQYDIVCVVIYCQFLAPYIVLAVIIVI